MMRVLLVILALLAGPVLADSAVVRDDGGGNVSRYIATRERLAQVDAVRIEGKCFSACTIFTTLPNACVHRAAQIGFHGTSPRVPFIQRWLDMRLGKYYRGEVARLYAAEWRHLRGADQMHVISGAQLKALDPQIRLCRRVP